MEIMGAVLSVTGLMMLIGALVVGVRGGQYGAMVGHQVLLLRRWHSLDRGRWRVVRRAVHRGVAAPPELRAAACDYAGALLRSSDRGVIAPVGVVGLVGTQLVQAHRLMDGISGLVDWLTVAGAVLIGSIAAWAPIGRARRTARARSAQTANG